MIYGTGKYRYELVENWLKLPEYWELGETSGVACDSRDRVFVLSRGVHPVTIFERDGQFLATVPEQGKNPYGRPIFQNLQYSDTPTQPLVPMRFTDLKTEAGKRHRYRAIAVNAVGLKSK